MVLLQLELRLAGLTKQTSSPPPPKKLKKKPHDNDIFSSDTHISFLLLRGGVHIQIQRSL